jgi:hypothetical protein
MKIKLWFCRYILNYINDTTLTLKLEHRFGLINTDLSPKKCRYCGNTEFKEEVTDRIENIVLEKNSYCSKCNMLCGCWIGGHWLP